MAVTQADIDALEAAINSGVDSVNYQGRSIKYRSQDAMVKRLKEMKRELAESSGQKITKQYRFKTDKGY